MKWPKKLSLGRLDCNIEIGVLIEGERLHRASQIDGQVDLEESFDHFLDLLESQKQSRKSLFLVILSVVVVELDLLAERGKHFGDVSPLVVHQRTGRGSQGEEMGKALACG